MGQLIRESGYVLSLWFLLCFSTMSLSASTSECWERSVLTCLGARSSRPPGGGGAQAVMSRRDAGLFLHAMYLFLPLYFPPFKKQTLSEPPVARHCGCCVHPAPALAKQYHLPLPRLAVLPGHWDLSHVRDHAAAAMQGPNTSPLSLISPRNGVYSVLGLFSPLMLQKASRSE